MFFSFSATGNPTGRTYGVGPLFPRGRQDGAERRLKVEYFVTWMTARSGLGGAGYNLNSLPRPIQKVEPNRFENE